MRHWLQSILVLTLLNNGCATTTPPDYTNFRQHMPKSILVLPPINHSIEVSAGGTYLSTISHPIAERGFYVFPVAIVDAFFKDQGLSEPAEIHQIPAEKLREIFGADAVFYVSIHQWGSKYHLIQSKTKVVAKGKLVDLKTEKILWQGTQIGESASNSSGGNLTSALVAAAVTQMVNSSTDESRAVAQHSAFRTIHGHNGFLKGPVGKRNHKK